jgi:hypothetical protein
MFRQHSRRNARISAFSSRRDHGTGVNASRGYSLLSRRSFDRLVLLALFIHLVNACCFFNTRPGVSHESAGFRFMFIVFIEYVFDDDEHRDEGHENDDDTDDRHHDAIGCCSVYHDYRILSNLLLIFANSITKTMMYITRYHEMLPSTPIA